MNDTIIKIEKVKKQYRLGLIGGGTLQGDLQSWWAKIRGKEDPNLKIGAKTYKKNERFMALDGIDLEVKSGERVGIIGHNGAGKSTLLKLLSRVTAPTEGNIYLNGRISSMLEVGTGFHGELTGRENIYLNGAILGMTRQEVDSKIDQIIEFSECGQFIDTPVKRYSSGMYVKLAFSVAAHLDSEILIMDEVLAVGDMAFQQKCIDKMSQVSTEEGRTILYVSHNMNTIRKLCNRCVVLDHGKVIFDGDVEEAINIYLKNSQVDLLSNIDLNLFERPKNTNKMARMNRLEFINNEECIYKNGDQIKFNLKWYSKSNLKDVRFRAIVRYKDDTAVGLAMSSPICDALKDTHYSTTLSLDSSLLSEGQYFFSIALYQSDENGKSIILDHITRACYFEIISNVDDKNLLVWEHRWWGAVKFPEFKILEQGEIENA